MSSEEKNQAFTCALILMEIRDGHIGIADRLNFEHIILFTQQVELCVQSVKHIHHQMRPHTAPELCVPHYVTEENRHTLLALGFHLAPFHQRLGYV
jgi:hypothetical protein